LSTNYLPEKYKGRLIEAHNEITKILQANQGRKDINNFTIRPPEPLKTAFNVEEYRWYWKPEKLKFVLVAESHVYTSEQEADVKIDLSKLNARVVGYPQDCPINFAKVVYCLGYGAPEILDHPEDAEAEGGTKQFMDLFRQCIGFSSYSRASLQSKSDLLKATKAKGVWLLDASCHGIAYGHMKRLFPDIVDRIVPISWRTYVRPIIEDLQIDPENVWIVGKGTHDLILGKYARGNNWIYQPNVRFKNNQKYKEKAEREQTLQERVKKAIEQP
jgi:hypothetical protein